jgi:NAD+ diphosphatase
VGTLDGVAYVAAALEPGTTLPSSLRSSGVRRLFGALEPRLVFVAALGGQLARFDLTTRFCGQCGGATTIAPEPLTKRCSACSRDLHPHVSPCVIVLVSDGPRVLLTRGPKFPPGMYGLVAGFVEPGETLEGCVVREVMEETGISISAPRYVASQPWPFPSQVMVGYVAERTGGEVRPDPSELEDAQFFGPDELPTLPPPISIARVLLDRFFAGTLPGPRSDDGA